MTGLMIAVEGDIVMHVRELLDATMYECEEGKIWIASKWLALIIDEEGAEERFTIYDTYARIS